jgi:hypothetical protein
LGRLPAVLAGCSCSFFSVFPGNIYLVFEIDYTYYCKLSSLGLNPLPPKFRIFDKAEPNSQFRGKHVCNNLIRIQVSLICKLSGTPD